MASEPAKPLAILHPTSDGQFFTSPDRALDGYDNLEESGRWDTCMQQIRAKLTVGSWQRFEYPPHLLLAGFWCRWHPFLMAANYSNVPLMKHLLQVWKVYLDKKEPDPKYQEWTARNLAELNRKEIPTSLLTLTSSSGMTAAHAVVRGLKDRDSTLETATQAVEFLAQEDKRLLNCVQGNEKGPSVLDVALSYVAQLELESDKLEKKRACDDMKQLVALLRKLGATSRYAGGSEEPAPKRRKTQAPDENEV